MSPYRAGRVCTYPGCDQLVYQGARCQAHAEAYHDQGYRAWYRTDRWRKIRAKQLLDHPWCEQCAREGRTVQATDVDHVQAHRGNEGSFFGGPFQSLCKSCHSRKTQREVRGGV